MTAGAAPGRLVLVPAPLDFGCDAQAPLAQVLPEGTLAQAAAITHWVCENAKTARAYLKRIGEHHPLALPLREQQIAELPREVHKKGDHAGGFDAAALLAPALQGHDLGLLSEAGMPAVADPGSSVVRAAHDLGIAVVPLVGPVSLLLALAASGLNGQHFAFVGYVPQDPAQRGQRLRELESLALKTGQTQLFIETPYRNLTLWESLCQVLRPDTRIAVASALTLPECVVAMAPVQQWRTRPAPVAKDRPAVFAIGR
ncbi:SAM-dependent methyltransferase [Ramlibacter solisilvae]|uniref:Uroporphyrin-III methyltransferase n=1 Tax=Ramlibacter tataouinensis TaxID=94132 RepID=A0A127JQ60_9BURK|nr:SAM-dependent methyltransferase [Ramlibacter tataouinensis]AMO22117.1 uroporphyrin-III methyltransferase [Ramlibacter tataouinensis]